MTDIASSGASSAGDIHQSDAAKKRLRGRYGSEARFKLIGLSAVLLAVLFLIIMLYTIVSQGYHAFTYHYLTLPIELKQSEIDPEGSGDEAKIRAADYTGMIRGALAEKLPFAEGRRDRRVRNGLITSAANIALQRHVLANPSEIGKTIEYPILLDDFGDLYMKDLITTPRFLATNGIASPLGTEGTIKILTSANDFRAITAEVTAYLSDLRIELQARVSAKQRSVARQTDLIASLEAELQTATPERLPIVENNLKSSRNALASAQSEITGFENQIATISQRIETPGDDNPLQRDMASFLIRINDGVVKVTNVRDTEITGDVLIPLSSEQEAQPGSWDIEVLDRPEADRKLTDKEIVWLDHLKKQGLIERKINSVFFSAGASREAEQAGILGAVMGSLFTMIVTLLLSFPIGVGAAIYLEEFAPKNKITQIIEININNLAAVPSIVFGLLGLAMFLNVFGFPRSAPLVGGMVLALMTLPTIIIASRAALRSVPPSIREAALGIGASRLQAVTHHVLPLAMPGILTGTIIGMAQALGETAPLLMIGMVAFIVDVPNGPLDAATVLPVQIYMWADFPEPAFQQKTSAAIMVLLAFLVAMNAIAIVLRKRFERRW